MGGNCMPRPTKQLWQQRQHLSIKTSMCAAEIQTEKWPLFSENIELVN